MRSSPPSRGAMVRRTSFLPFRRASRKELDPRGLLEFQMPVPHERDAIERHLLRDTAYEALCEAIVGGTLVPGETLHDDELCAWLGLSRTPVRNALLRLAEEGLVESAPQRFTRVAPLDAKRARDLFPLLAVLHGLATELAVPRIRAEDVQALNLAIDDFVRALRAADASGAYEADNRFHAIFLSAGDNEHIVASLDRLQPQLRRLEQHVTGPLPGRRSVAQHQAIVARTATGDAVGAASAVRANWMTLGTVIDRALSAGTQV
jgi:DNA-binding GntR family transcriptional regulator